MLVQEVFFVKKGGDQKNNNTSFVFLFCPTTFISSYKKHIIYHIKMADTSMDYSEYSENENSPMPVAKVR